jgi:hypothetical protein
MRTNALLAKGSDEPARCPCPAGPQGVGSSCSPFVSDRNLGHMRPLVKCQFPENFKSTGAQRTSGFIERDAGPMRFPQCADSPSHSTARSQEQHPRHGILIVARILNLELLGGKTRSRTRERHCVSKRRFTSFPSRRRARTSREILARLWRWPGLWGRRRRPDRAVARLNRRGRERCACRRLRPECPGPDGRRA